MNDAKIEQLIKEVFRENKENKAGAEKEFKEEKENAIKRIKLFIEQFDIEVPLDGLIASILHQVIGRVGSEISNANISNGSEAVRIAATELLGIADKMMDASIACEKHKKNKYKNGD